MTENTERPSNLKTLRDSGWQSKSVKREVHDNFLRMLASGEELFPGIIGFDDTVIPELTRPSWRVARACPPSRPCTSA